MERAVVADPFDVTFPLSQSIYSDPYVVFHGTGSQHARGIEASGFMHNRVPYEWADVEAVMQIAASLHLEHSPRQHYAVLHAYSAGAGNAYVNSKPLSFACSYWQARNYAAYGGSETEHYLVECATEARDIITSEKAQMRHLHMLQEQNPSHYANAASWLEDQEARVTTAFLEQVASRYRRSSTYGSVFALKLREEQLEKPGQSPCGVRLTRGNKFREVRLREDAIVDPGQILARVDFPEGVHRWRPVKDRLPLPWEGACGCWSEATDDQDREMLRRGFQFEGIDPTEQSNKPLQPPPDDASREGGHG